MKNDLLSVQESRTMTLGLELGNVLLSSNPFIDLLAIDGFQSQSDKTGGVNFFIISKENRVPECLAACRYQSSRFAGQTTGDDGLFSFNNIVDKTAMLSEIRIDRFSANELLNLNVISGGQTYLELLLGNPQIAGFFPRRYLQRVLVVYAALAGSA